MINTFYILLLYEQRDINVNAFVILTLLVNYNVLKSDSVQLSFRRT